MKYFLRRAAEGQLRTAFTFLRGISASHYTASRAALTFSLLAFAISHWLFITPLMPLADYSFHSFHISIIEYIFITTEGHNNNS